LLVTPLHGGELTSLAPVLVHTLAHSWFASNHAWLDEGVAQFMSLLWVETNDGRQAGLDRLQSSGSALALAEPDFSANKPAQGQSLIAASSEVYYRTKAAAVLWMLRSLTERRGA
jgi:aminopeptidase N